MGDVISLSRARKARVRAEEQKVAERNRKLFGLTRAEKEALKRASDKTMRDLDAKKIEE